MFLVFISCLIFLLIHTNCACLISHVRLPRFGVPVLYHSFQRNQYRTFSFFLTVLFVLYSNGRVAAFILQVLLLVDIVVYYSFSSSHCNLLHTVLLLSYVVYIPVYIHLPYRVVMNCHFSFVFLALLGLVYAFTFFTLTRAHFFGLRRRFNCRVFC